LLKIRSKILVTIRCQEAIFQGVEAVIFDKDGTLADSHHFLLKLAQQRIHLVCQQVPNLQEPLEQAFGVQANQISPAGLMAVGTRRENEVAAAAFITATGLEWSKSLTIAQQTFETADRQMGRKADFTPLFDGGTELLKNLHRAGLKLGILSADTTLNVQDFVQRYNLAPYLDLQQGTDEGVSKPDPQLFWQACSALAVSPAKTLMVGDSSADVQMAKAAGAIGCALATWGWTNATALKQLLKTFSAPTWILCPIHHLSEIQVDF
jgi:phosphoglycolate phosphatase